MKLRILVAMSGGVDSSVTALLLQQQGHSVEGVTMKLAAGVCCDIASAQSVCARLGIPHRMIDLQKDFEDAVVRDFIGEYRRGRTPNPCIRCNALIKFSVLLSYAREQGFDFLATGHYARIEADGTSSRLLLKKGVDASKDQSYFLYRLTQDQMRHLVLPLGAHRKTDVRRLAVDRSLPSSGRPESQEVCFIPGDDYRAFLKEHAPDTVRPGEMVTTSGSVVGRHDGVAFFTVGQRRKLGVAAGERRYVVSIDTAKRQVVLGSAADLQRTVAFASDLNFIPFDALAAPRDVTVKVRYRSPLEPAVIDPAGPGRVRITFGRPVPSVSPGQAAVFYDGDLVVGGGALEDDGEP